MLLNSCLVNRIIYWLIEEANTFLDYPTFHDIVSQANTQKYTQKFIYIDLFQ